MKLMCNHYVKKISISIFIFGGLLLYSQVGINTLQPQSSLHIEIENPNSPKNTDGILIPRVVTLPASGNEIGQLLFLNNESTNSGFYIWTGTDWDLLVKNNLNRMIDESIYIITGDNTTTTYNTSYNLYNLLFNTIKASNLEGFSVSGNKITIGKTGTYLINVSSSLKTEHSSGRRSTFKYTLRKIVTSPTNQLLTTDEASATSSIPNEKITATNVSFSHILYLEKDDKIEVVRQKVSDANNSIDLGFIPYGNNTIRLTFLQ